MFRYFAVLACLFVNTFAFAATKPIMRMYVFGDSYSAYHGTTIEQDGPTSIVYAARMLGLDIVPPEQPIATDKSINFAVGGAKTGIDRVGHIPEGVDPNVGMKSQVAHFEQLVHSGTLHFNPETTLFFIAGGLNDRMVPIEETHENLIAEIATLYTLGARHFRLAVLPLKIHRFTPLGERLNPMLRAIPGEMTAKYPNIDIRNSEWGAYYDVVFSDPAKYGFTNTTEPCYLPKTNDQPRSVCDDPKTHIYYPTNHPSTAVHKIVGEMLYKELSQQ